MKILVAYMSQTGNTKKVAEAIYGEITEDKEIKELKDAESLEGYDLSFVGFPIHAFGPAKEAKKFLEDHSEGKRVALFITHAAKEGSELLEEWLGRCRKAAAGAEVVGMFDCQGELSKDVMDMLLKSDDPNMRSFGEMGSETKGKPDSSSLEKAKEFARETIKKI